MAQGDLTIFEEALVPMFEDDANNQQIDFENDTFKMSLVKDGGSDPTAADPAPAYSGGTTNWNGASDEADDGGTYTNGGATLSSPTLSEAGGTVTFDCGNATWAADASNDTAVKWAIIYDDTTTIKHAIAFIDLGTAFDMTSGDLTVNIASGGVFQASIQPSV